MAAPLQPIPEDADVIGVGKKISKRYFLWLYDLWTRVLSNVAVQGTLSKSTQIAALGPTTLLTTTQAALYRAEYYIRVTTLPGTSFSLTVTITWRDGGVTKSQTFPALTGAPGTLATAYQADQIPFMADRGTTIAISVAYASVGVPAAAWALDAAAELIR